MSGADSTTEVTPTGRYEDHSLCIASRPHTAEGREPPMNADARRCSAPLIGVHRRFLPAGRYELLASSTRWPPSSQNGQI